MQVSTISVAKRVGKFTEHTNPKVKARIKVEWDKSVDKVTLKDNAGRVYLLCVNGVVMKIGGSQCEGGIKSTMGFYCGGTTGRPSIRTFGINQYVWDEIQAGNEVEIYMINSKRVPAPVQGLYDIETMDVAAFKEMESKCVSDYVTMEGKNPAWNMQESAEAWPTYIQEAHRELLKSK
jgi:hypothetical protein